MSYAIHKSPFEEHLNLHLVVFLIMIYQMMYTVFFNKKNGANAFTKFIRLTNLLPHVEKAVKATCLTTC
jgi:hypothetical protein